MTSVIILLALLVCVLIFGLYVQEKYWKKKVSYHKYFTIDLSNELEDYERSYPKLVKKNYELEEENKKLRKDIEDLSLKLSYLKKISYEKRRNLS